MANHSQGKFWSPSLLKTRGWTNDLIEKLLPKPRYRRINGRSTPIWHRDDVRAAEETDLFNEGCLSLPGLHEDVRRPVAIRMRYLDENFVEHDEEFDGYPARVIQHEYDHIEGKVFTDHLSPLRRNLLKGKILNLAKGKYRCAYKTK